mgnify:CR=1 FL=1
METLTLTSKTYAFLYLNNIVLNPQAETKVSTTGLSTSNYTQLAEYIRRGMIKVDSSTLTFIEGKALSSEGVKSINGKSGTVVITNTDVGAPSLSEFTILKDRVISMSEEVPAQD